MKKNNKKISVSNYVIVVAIMLVSMFSVILLRNLYLSREDNKLSVPVLRDVLTHEITSSEVDNYINENPDVIMYISVSKDKECRNFEKSIIDYININKLNNEIVYVNLNQKEVDGFFDKFNKNYNNNEKLEDYPLFVYIKDGKIENILDGKISENDITLFLDGVGLDNND